MIQLTELLNPNESSTETCVSLTAIVDSAICVGAGGSSGSLADKPIVRTASGNLLIPASQLKGRLRHECEKLLRGLGWPICHSPVPENMCSEWADVGHDAFTAEPNYRLDYSDRLLPLSEEHSDHKVAEASTQPNPNDKTPRPDDYRYYHCYICQIFGNPTLASSVIFDDLICQDSDPAHYQPVLRPGVTINRRRRTAEDKKLFLLETSPPQTQLAFEGKIHILPTAPNFTPTLLSLALSNIHALGGSKSAGLGWLHWQHDLQANLKALNSLRR